MFSRPIKRLRSDQLWSSGQAATLKKIEGVILFYGILCNCHEKITKKGGKRKHEAN